MKFFLNKRLPTHVKTSEFLIFLEGLFNNFKCQNKLFMRTPQNYHFDEFVFCNGPHVNFLILGFKISLDILNNFKIFNFQVSSLNLATLLKKFFKKFSAANSYTTKHPSGDFKYFWIFKKSGFYWKKNFFSYRNYNDSKYRYFSKFLLKFNFIKILKFFWSFNKKLSVKRRVKKFNLISPTAKKIGFFLKNWKLPILIPQFVNKDCNFALLIWVVGINFFFLFSYFSKALHIFFKNLRKVRIKENTYTSIRKRFQTFYLYKTFEHAYHRYWCDFKYCEVTDFYLVSYAENLVNVVGFFFFKDGGDQDTLINEFTTSILWKKVKRFVRLDNRGFFFWEHRNGRRKKKFKKLFMAKIIFNNTHIFSPDLSMFGLAKLLTSFNHFNLGLSLHDFNLENFLGKLENFKNLLFYCEFLPEFNLVKSYQYLFFKKSLVSNYSFFFLLPSEVKNLIVKKRVLIKDPINHKYLNYYFTNFIGFFSKMKSLFIFNTNQLFGNDFVTECISYCSEIFLFFKKLNKKFFKQFQLVQFMELLFFSFLKKDLNYFIKFFKFILENMFLKKHKKVFYAFDFILNKFFTKIFFFTKVRGFRFEIAGKISVTGNAKTRNKIVSFGAYSLTNKSLKISYLQDTVRTTTGVLGIKTYLTY